VTTPRGRAADGVRLRLVSIHSVAAGDELCIAYLDARLPTARREAKCRAVYSFACACERCRVTPPPQSPEAGGWRLKGG
jgi:hypothetical protein